MNSQVFIKSFCKNDQPNLELFLSYYFNIGRFDAKNIEITKKDEKIIRRKFSEYMHGKPLQYVLGFTYFYGRTFNVNKNVLIPRQDTECLVENALKNINKTNNVLDLCCGSGCIGVTISKESGASVTCSDISAKALQVAKKNARDNNANVSFVKSDIFNKIKERFNVIVSNPPYIETQEIEKLENVVKDFEPHLALDGKENGLFFYEQIVANAKDYLKKDGLLFFEVGINQAENVKKLMEKDFENIKIVKDLGGIDRVCFGSLRENIN